MDKNKKYIAGQCGMVDSAVWRSFESKIFSNLIGKEVISINSKYYRPTEVYYLVGEPTKAKLC